VPLAAQDFILGDAGYWSTAEIGFAQRRGADVLIRVNPQSFIAYATGNRRFGLLTRLRSLKQAGDVGEWPVTLRGKDIAVPGRVCAIRKSEHAIAQAHRRLHRKASKKQTKVQPQTLEYARYVIVFTTDKSGSAQEILELYRLRWQIELVFKRMKAIAQLGHLPKQDERSARAWLYGKLLVALLTQKMIRIGRDISPWGYMLQPTAAA
jgi:Transposase DDE domain